VIDLSGATGTTNVAVVGTVPVNVISGTNVNVVTGTITTGSLSNVAMLNAGTVVVPSGTVNVGTFVMPSGTVTTGSLTNVANLVNGSVNILTGTLQSSGTTTGVGVVTSVTNLVAGTLLNSGTTTGVGVVTSVSELVKGTVTNLVSGTINALAAGTITTGTVSVTTGTVVLNTGTITTIAAGTQNTLGTVANLNNGSVNILTGTVTSVTNLAGGTVSVNQAQIGSSVLSYGTLGTTGAAVFGTILAAVGAGTSIYLTGLSMVVQTGTVDVAIANGTGGPATGPGGLNTYARGAFPAGGGITTPITVPIKSGTNGTLVFWMGGAGTAYFQANYWVGP
jgi:acylphosphatase